MSDFDPSATFPGLRDHLCASLRLALARYRGLEGAWPRVDDEVVRPRSRDRRVERFFSGHASGFNRAFSRLWIESEAGWQDFMGVASASELLRARDEVWEMVCEVCHTHGLPVPAPPWEQHVLTHTSLHLPRYLRGRPPPPWTATELEGHYLTALRALLAEGTAGGEIRLADVAVKVGKDSTTLSRWQTQLQLGPFRALRDRLLLTLDGAP